MRITGGHAKGRKLTIPLASGVRPTSSRVREALFSMLGSNLDGLNFLDAFGGAGLIGLEAWSRGAQVTVVEQNGRAYRDIVSRGKLLEANWSTKRGDVLKLAHQFAPFDIVFADPPYALPLEPILEALGPLADETLIVESLADFEPPTHQSGLALDRKRTYGNSALSVYRRI